MTIGKGKVTRNILLCRNLYHFIKEKNEGEGYGEGSDIISRLRHYSCVTEKEWWVVVDEVYQ